MVGGFILSDGGEVIYESDFQTVTRHVVGDALVLRRVMGWQQWRSSY